jgi:hypothetical protein
MDVLKSNRRPVGLVDVVERLGGGGMHTSPRLIKGVVAGDDATDDDAEVAGEVSQERNGAAGRSGDSGVCSTYRILYLFGT